MTNKKKFFLWVAIFCSGILIFGSQNVLAQEAAAGTNDVVTTEESDTAPIPTLFSENAETATTEPIKIPTAWGLLWSGVKERVNLALTFDALKKAEKQMLYAEEKLKIAEALAESTEDPGLKLRAEQMVERATNLIQNIEQKREKWAEKDQERAEKLLLRTAENSEVRQRILDKVEGSIPPERLKAFTEMREKTLETDRRLINAINNENIPENIKEKLQLIRERVENHLEDVKSFREQRNDILEKAAEGDETVKRQLEDAREAFKQEQDREREAYKNRIGELKTITEQQRERAKDALEKRMEDRAQLRQGQTDSNDDEEAQEDEVEVE